MALALLGANACGETVLEPIVSNSGPLVEGGAGASSGGTGTGGVGFTECRLETSPVGWVSSALNDCHAQGSWYAYDDCNDSPGDCTTNHLPVEGEFPNEASVMCTSGTTALPANDAELASKWGAGIGVFLNQDPDTSNKLTLGGLGLDIVGVRFELTSDDVPGILVNFPMDSTEDRAHMAPDELGPGTHTIYFDDAISPYWDPDPVPLKPEQIISVQFQVPTEVGVSRGFHFCVEDLTLLL